MFQISTRVLLAGSLLLLVGMPARAQEGTWALVNGRIHTVTGVVIERGTIVIRNGLIVAVGADAPVPPDARMLDLGGRDISPGIIDLASTIGGSPAPASRGQRASGGAGARGQGAAAGDTRPAGLDPAAITTDDLKLSAADVRAAREAGITAILVSPAGGAFRGRSALLPTRDSVAAAQSLKAPVAVHLGFEGVRGQYPATLLGVIAYQRQRLYDAKRYGLLSDQYATNPRGIARPTFDPGLEALVPAVRRQIPVFVDASEENEIRRAVRLAKEFDLDLVVTGATEAWRALDALEGHAVVVSVEYPKASKVTGWSYRLTGSPTTPDSATVSQAARLTIEGNAAALHRAGVSFALGTGGARPSDFLANVRKAVAAGLPRETALAALTIQPATLAGLGDALGSIEVGKIANLVVTDRGDLLADSARVHLVFVDGIRYPVSPRRPVRRGTTPTASAQLAGTWVMTINTPQGAQEVTMVVTQSGDQFTGSMTSVLGTTEFNDGQIDGPAVSWSMILDLGGNAMTITYQGEVDGDRMTGSAVLGEFGTAGFTAEKTP